MPKGRARGVKEENELEVARRRRVGWRWADIMSVWMPKGRARGVKEENEFEVGRHHECVDAKGKG
eukprot:1160814-Pelagomonas_calceolata.AAC.13